MKFNKIYFILFIILFLVEISIAYFIKTGFVRHTFGDFLVVVMLYCFLKSFINMKPLKVGICVLLIAFVIEFLQRTPMLEWLHLQDNALAKTILGSTFHTSDLVAYTLGVIAIITIEYVINKVNS